MSLCYYLQFLSWGPKTAYTIRIPVVSLRGHGQRIDSISRTGNHGCDGQHPKMITPTLLRARSFDEPGAGIPHAGICEAAVG
jgi:hypothetical protein